MKIFIEQLGDKNEFGGEVIEELNYGKLRLVYQTIRYPRNNEITMENEVALYVNDKLLYTVFPVNNERVFKEFWEMCKDYIEQTKQEDGTGESSYYNYQKHFELVKIDLIDTMDMYKNKLQYTDYTESYTYNRFLDDEYEPEESEYSDLGIDTRTGRKWGVPTDFEGEDDEWDLDNNCPADSFYDSYTEL